MTTTASPGRKVSYPGKQPSPQARAAARRYATVLALIATLGPFFYGFEGMVLNGAFEAVCGVFSPMLGSYGYPFLLLCRVVGGLEQFDALTPLQVA